MPNLKRLALVCSLSLLAASCNPFSQSGVAGIAKTVNGGADWQFQNKLTNVKDGSLSALNVSSLGFDPNKTDTVYASGYNGGLYRSEDAGSGWARILSKVFVYDFAVDPTNGRTVYAAGIYGGSGKVLKTIDGGASWQEVYSEGSQNTEVRSVAVNPASPSQVAIGTASGNVITSSDGGLTWKLWKDFQDRTNSVFWQHGAFYALLKTKGLYRATNVGGEFQSLSEQFAVGPLQGYLSEGKKISVDEFRQVFVDEVSANLVYLTTSKGLYKTVDGGKSWAEVRLPIKDQANAPRAVAVAKSSSNVVFVSIGATIYKSTDGGSSWQTQSLATTGFVNYILVDPQRPQVVYAGVHGGN